MCLENDVRGYSNLYDTFPPRLARTTPIIAKRGPAACQYTAWWYPLPGQY